MAEKKPEGKPCPSCKRIVKPGVACRQMFCPWEHSLNYQGIPTLARPLKSRWHF